MSEHQPPQNEIAGEPQFEPKLQGFFRRHLGLIVAVLAVLVIGPTISTVLDSFEGVVLEVKGEDAFVGFEQFPPKWVEGVQASPGDILVKSTGSWSPAVVVAQPSHRNLSDLFARYVSTYTATVVEIMPPAAQGGVSSALIRMDETGDEIIMSVHSEELMDLALGDRIEKKINSWDPVIVKAKEPSPTVTEPVGRETSPSGG